jgi:hypothetical protein
MMEPLPSPVPQPTRLNRVRDWTGDLDAGGSAILYPVSPTILRVRGFRFYFFSREERRPHVHVQHAEGEAKFWIDPTVELQANYGLKPKRLAEAERLVEEHLNEIRSAWAKHFPD